LVEPISSTPRLVQKAIDHAEKSRFCTLEKILISVLMEESLSETLQTLEEGGGWEYVFFLFEYVSAQYSVKSAWERHYESENK